jgi:hypothetical protein
MVTVIGVVVIDIRDAIVTVTGIMLNIATR